ncbi:MAG: preprotein translocase subunit SecE [Pseudomonadota bacterium]
MNVNAEGSASQAGKLIDAVKWLAVFVLLAVAVVGNAYYGEQPLFYRTAIGVLLIAAAAALALTTAKGRQFNEFRREAMVELRKIVWPTRQETLQTTLIVFVVVAVVAFILWVLDLLLGWAVSGIIG